LSNWIWYVIGLVKSWLFCHVPNVQGINTLNIWFQCISIYKAQLVHTVQEKLQKPLVVEVLWDLFCHKIPSQCTCIITISKTINCFITYAKKRKTCANPVIQYISNLTDVSCKETLWILLYVGINWAVLGPVLSVLKYTNA